jgi:hypothetical protein
MTDLSSPELPAGSHEPEPNLIRWIKENSVPIVSLACLVLLLCLIGHYGSITIDWSKTKDFTDAFSNVTQGLGLVAGGIWAYFKFVKGRAFQETLIPIVSGRLVLIEGYALLIVTMEIKNVGSSKVMFNQELSVLTIFEYVPPDPQQIDIVMDNALTSLPAFVDAKDHLEPNESIKTQRLLALSDLSRIAYRLELEINSDSGYIWRTMSIVDKLTLADNDVEQLLDLEEVLGK